MVNKIVAAFVTLLIVVASAEALKCYVCEYVDGKLPPGTPSESEDSCKTGKKPKDALSVDCSTLQYEPIFDGRTYGVPKTSRLLRKAGEDAKAISPLQANNNMAYSCVKVTVDGKFLITNENMKTTFRTCVMELNTTESLPNKCYANEISKIGADIQEPILAVIVDQYAPGFEDSSDAGICSCNTDDCNGANNSVSVSIFVLLASTFVAHFSNIL
ncbi:unnamed protein product [Orchesella dallaii]|uniref:Protein quiver n=1 Tax=Orchesella dallaii TaxID=48710 RepID=A0ABP1RLZ0_9HEXA